MNPGDILVDQQIGALQNRIMEGLYKKKWYHFTTRTILKIMSLN